MRQRIEASRLDPVPIVIITAALMIRLAVIALQWDLKPTIDAGDYDRHARSISSGDGYPTTLIADPGGPTALRPPAWPFVLGAAYALPGDGFTAGRILGALLGALTVGLVAALGTELWGRRAGLIAAALAAICPSLFFLSSTVMSESIFLPLVLGLALVMVKASRAESRLLLWAAAIGVLCGIAALTRVIGVALAFPAALVMWRKPRLRVRSLVAPAVVGVAAILTVTPWIVRNTVVFDRFVPLATQEGFNLYGTYNEVAATSTEFPAGWHFPLELPRSRGLFLREGIDEAEISARLGAWARQYVVDHPLYPARVVYWNTRRMLMLADLHPSELLDYQQMGVPYRAINVVRASVVVTYLLALLAALVLIAKRSWPRPPFAVWLLPAFLYGSAAIFLIVPRYRIPLDPFLLMVIGAGAASLFTVGNTAHTH